VSALYSGQDISLDYNKVRPAGARLKTMGGRSSGPGPLAQLHSFIKETFNVARGRKLTSLECHDILNEIAQIVVVGGVRRSSEISLSDLDDELMRGAKSGNFPVRRYMANNSAIYYSKPDIVTFMKEWTALIASGSGERGISNLFAARELAPKRRDKSLISGSNPCHEIMLRSQEFCNLSEVVVRADDDIDTMLEKIETATWAGIIQACFTNFPYLSKKWKENCDEERLLGVSITGQFDAPHLFTKEALKAYKSKAIKVAKKASETMGIPMPAAITCVKPSGCRPWDALTTTSAGIFTLEELFEDHVEGEVWSDFTKDIGVLCESNTQKITKTYDNGLSDIHEITMTYGLSVQSTPNHKWFVVGEKTGKGMAGIVPINQWMEAKDIREKHVIQIIPNLYKSERHARLVSLNSRSIKMRGDCDEIVQPDFLSEDLCWFLGYLWGDGAMSPGKYRVRFTDQHVFNLQKAQKVVKQVFNLDTVLNKASKNRDAYTLDIASKTLWHWLIKNGVWKYFADKLDIMPVCVRTSSKSDIISFIAGLIDSDGRCGISKDNVKKATITTSYIDFARHLQHVAWSVGICIGRSLNDKGKNLQKNKEMYLMQISSVSDPGSCRELIRHSTKMSRMEEAGAGRWFFEADISKVLPFVGVVSDNKVIGKKETFDIEVEGEHQYFNGSVRSHNTVSQLVDSSSGLHPRFSKYYIRRYRISATDPLFRMVRDQGLPVSPENGQRKQDYVKALKAYEAGQLLGGDEALAMREAKGICPMFDNNGWTADKVNTWIVSFPVAAPKNAITVEDVSAIDQLEHYKKIQKNWCEHNASITVYAKSEEWLTIGDWVYKNWDIVNGISFLPISEHVYEQAPYEKITKEEYDKMAKTFPKIDYSQLGKYETEDNTEGAKSLACQGGACDL
jgi:hypothetical protein